MKKVDNGTFSASKIYDRYSIAEKRRFFSAQLANFAHEHRENCIQYCTLNWFYEVLVICFEGLLLYYLVLTQQIVYRPPNQGWPDKQNQDAAKRITQMR